MAGLARQECLTSSSTASPFFPPTHAGAPRSPLRGVKAVILCDAGVGRERAGIGGLDYLDALGVAAATVGHRSARIGDGADCFTRGLISHVNSLARAADVAPGITAREALERLERADLPPCPVPPASEERRFRLAEAEAPGVRVHAIDSAGLVLPEDAGHIVATGSHGALLGGRPETAIKIPVFAAVCRCSIRAASRAPASAPGARASATASRPIMMASCRP